MQRRIEAWDIKDLAERHREIHFTSIKNGTWWSLFSKQSLMDSIIRGLDIGQILLIERPDGLFECLDGQRRLEAIWSFLGLNPADEDNNFPLDFKVVKTEPPHKMLSEFRSKTYKDILRVGPSHPGSLAAKCIDTILDYNLVMTILSDIESPGEFQAQASRGSGVLLTNTSNRLKTMMGDARDTCFSEGDLGSHPFLGAVDVPHLFHPRESFAAEVLAQVFWQSKNTHFNKSNRHHVMRFVKEYSKMDAEHHALVARVSALFDHMEKPFADVTAMKDRAFALVTVLAAWRMDISTAEEAEQLADFVRDLDAKFQQIARHQVPINPHKDEVMLQALLSRNAIKHINYLVFMFTIMFDVWKPREQRQYQQAV